jgi:hypothetical protein
VSCIANIANLSHEEKQHIRELRGLKIESFNEDPVVDRLLQFIRMEKPYFRGLIRAGEFHRPWFVVPKLSNRRIIAQGGAFLMPLDILWSAIHNLQCRSRLLLSTSAVAAPDVAARAAADIVGIAGSERLRGLGS